METEKVLLFNPLNFLIGSTDEIGKLKSAVISIPIPIPTPTSMILVESVSYPAYIIFSIMMYEPSVAPYGARFYSTLSRGLRPSLVALTPSG